uniref:Sulfotransferase domain-containing protein n=1 Tax=Plectus sambesii TaxID=2011161 RepID=A0A914W5M6_9BILA
MATERGVEEEDPTNFFVKVPGEPRRKCIDGQMWPSLVRAEHVRSAKRYQPDDDDLFVVTFPKCGTTWTQNICTQLMHNGYAPEHGKELYLVSPMIEAKGAQGVKDLPRPRVIKTHFNYPDIPKGPGVRYVFVARNPKDVCVSFFFHHIAIKGLYDWTDGKFDDFFELFFAGKLEYGDYFEYMRGWMPHYEDPNVLVLKYEDMLTDLPSAVKRIAAFLGGPAEQAVATPGQLQKIVANCSFDEMSKEQKRFFALDNENHSFIRKGQKKDWLNHFSKEQSERVDQMWKEHMTGTPMEHWWSEEMKYEERHE